MVVWYLNLFVIKFLFNKWNKNIFYIYILNKYILKFLRKMFSDFRLNEKVFYSWMWLLKKCLGVWFFIFSYGWFNVNKLFFYII